MTFEILSTSSEVDNRVPADELRAGSATCQEGFPRSVRLAYLIKSFDECNKTKTFISKFGKKIPAIVIPTIHRRDFGTITLGFQ